ncbi:MAG: autotransporter outer membrane beta-barrel domain-containing protein [Fusobacteriaceae bacterium]
MFLNVLSKARGIKCNEKGGENRLKLGALLLILMSSTILSATDQQVIEKEFSDEKQHHKYGVITSLTGYFNNNRIKNSNEKNVKAKENLNGKSENENTITKPPTDIFRNVWINGMQQKKNIYLNNSILNPTTHGLRSYGAETNIENINQIIVSNSLDIKPDIKSTEDTVDFKNGKITSGVYKDYLFGALIEKNSHFVNNGIIETDGKTGGIFLQSGAKVENNGELIGKADVGIYSSGVDTIAINTVKGKISFEGNSGMFSNHGATIINEGEISNSGKIGMSARDEGTIINRGTISNSGSYGLHITGEGSRAINDGIISNKKSYGAVAENGAKIINNNIVSNAGSYGMVAINGGVVNNIGVVSNKSIWALYAYGKDSIAINNGIIKNSETGSMLAAGGGTILNNHGKTSRLMRVDGKNSMGINLGSISYKGAVGMKSSNDGEAINKGTISNDGIYGMVAESGGKISNLGDIKNNGANGMYALGVNSIAINEGIVANNGTFGMLASYGATAENRGVIANTGVYGLIASGTGSKAINKNIIENKDSYGLRAIAGGTVINEGIVRNTGRYKMYAEEPGSVAVNRGTIIVDQDSQIAMFARDKGAIINDTTGEIYLNSTNGVGMVANGDESTIINNGKIYLGGISGLVVTGNDYTTHDANGNFAMRLDNGASLTNINTIVITNDLSSTIPNSGITVTNDSEIINEGNFIVKGNLDSKAIVDSTSKFIVESGVIEAQSIKGDYYMSPAPTQGVYDNIVKINDLFITDNMSANIYSNSVMYDAKIISSDDLSSYGVEMKRKNFSSIIENNSYASYLENNYTATGTSAKTKLYDIYKNIDTKEKLNLAVNNTFGDSIYPVLMKQTFDMVRSNNKRIKDEVLNFPSIDETRYIGFANFTDSDVKLENNQSDYSSRISSVSLGIDKLVMPNFRLGGIVTVGKTNYDFEDNNAKRDEDIYQFNLIGMYQKGNLLSSASIFVGKSSGDLKRDSSLPKINEEMSGDIKNKYSGIDLSVEKRYDIKKVKVIPKAAFNVITDEQKGIKESGTYGLSTDSVNSTSVEGGVGLGLERTFAFKNDLKVTPAIDAMYYREFADPYEKTQAKIKSISNDKVKISSYDADKDRGVIEISTNIEKNDFNLKLGAQYDVNETDSEVMPFARVIYRY